jgi:dihydroxyacetone kinase-like predicted kinase
MGQASVICQGRAVSYSTAQSWLERHHEIVNALNVFRSRWRYGTNMLLTMKSACREITEEHTGSVVRWPGLPHGALMGARGNSGVILSQILRGMSKSLAEQVELTGPAFAAALTEGSRVAYKGVNRPVEGTILTVVREAAMAAESVVETNADLSFVLAHTVRAADRAVANTPNLLPVLAQAGKVDSGGKGLFYILEAFTATQRRHGHGRRRRCDGSSTSTRAPAPKGQTRTATSGPWL